MAMRWTAAAMQEASKGFRRLKAHKQLQHCFAKPCWSDKQSLLQVIGLPKPQRLPNISTRNDRFVNFNITRDNSLFGIML